jgi:hypothetical protein
MKISELFKDEPIQWGLRGDPHLRREMSEQLSEINIPVSSAELKLILEKTYLFATKREITNDEVFHVDRFSLGSMSSGGISPKFWKENGTKNSF